MNKARTSAVRSRPPLWAALVALSFCVPPAWAQQKYPIFNQLDYFWAQNPQRFKTLWQASQTRTMRVALRSTVTGAEAGPSASSDAPRPVWAVASRRFDGANRTARREIQ